MSSNIDEFDVIVVGAGFAGSVCAVRAVELGLHTLLLEKTSLEPSWSNSRVSGGGLHLSGMGIDTAPEVLVEKLMAESGGACRPSLVATYAREARSAVSWLQKQGIEMKPDNHGGMALQPQVRNRTRLVGEGYGPYKTLVTLKATFAELGGIFRGSHQVVALLTQDGRVSGVEATTADRTSVQLRSSAVVLTDGGFQANREMVNRYIGPNAGDQIKIRGANSGTGDGIRMATRIGAKLINTESFYGYCLSIDALHNDDLWPNPVLDELAAHALVVWAASGKRFADESIPGFLPNAIARSLTPRDAVLVCDSVGWDSARDPAQSGAHAQRVAGVAAAPNPTLVTNGGTVYVADSLAELAEKSGINSVGLLSTVAAFNGAARTDTASLEVPRGGQLVPLEKPPYYAIPMVPGITHTLGGLLINSDANVLNEDEQPIPGLYAAGATAAGLDGGPHAGYAGGLAPGLVFGKRAAEHIRAQRGVPAKARA
jgi:fumarate reductase flavoprotein subunit